MSSDRKFQALTDYQCQKSREKIEMREFDLPSRLLCTAGNGMLSEFHNQYISRQKAWVFRHNRIQDQ